MSHRSLSFRSKEKILLNFCYSTIVALTFAACPTDPKRNPEPGCHYNKAIYGAEIVNAVLGNAVLGVNNIGSGTGVRYYGVNYKQATYYSGDFNRNSGGYEKAGATLVVDPLNKAANPTGETYGRDLNDENFIIGFGHPTSAKSSFQALYIKPNNTDFTASQNESLKAQYIAMISQPVALPFPAGSSLNNSFAFSVSNDLDASANYEFVVAGMLSGDTNADPELVVQNDSYNHLTKKVLGTNTRAVYWRLTGNGSGPFTVNEAAIIPGLTSEVSEARSVNGIGNIVGTRLTAGSERAFIYCRSRCASTGVYNLSPLAGDIKSYALSIDDWLTPASSVKPISSTPVGDYSDGVNYIRPGQVYGFSVSASGLYRATMWKYAAGAWTATELATGNTGDDIITSASGFSIAVGQQGGKAMLLQDGVDPVDLSTKVNNLTFNEQTVVLRKALDVGSDGTVAAYGEYYYSGIWNPIYFLLQPAYYTVKKINLPTSNRKDPTPPSLITYVKADGSSMTAPTGYSTDSSYNKQKPSLWMDSIVDYQGRELATYNTGPLSWARLNTAVSTGLGSAIVFGEGSETSSTNTALAWSVTDAGSSAAIKLAAPASGINLKSVLSAKMVTNDIVGAGFGTQASGSINKAFVAYNFTASSPTVIPLETVSDSIPSEARGIDSNGGVVGYKGTSPVYWGKNAGMSYGSSAALATPSLTTTVFKSQAEDISLGTTETNEDDRLFNKDAIAGWAQESNSTGPITSYMWRRSSAGSSWLSPTTNPSDAHQSMVIRFQGAANSKTKIKAVNDKTQAVGQASTTKPINFSERPDVPTVENTNIAVFFDAYNEKGRIQDINLIISPRDDFSKIDDAWDIDDAGNISVTGVLRNGKRGAALVIPPAEDNPHVCK